MNLRNHFLDHYSKGDLIIAFSVMIQPLLVVLQFIMISVFYFPEEVSTRYRVIFTAIPMLAAIIVGFKRKTTVFLLCYAVLFLFLGIEYLFFPANGGYIWTVSFRFLVPMIVPSIICLSCLNNVNVVEDAIYIYSWFIIVLILFFVLRFIQGGVDFKTYNMGLSYALLLPMVSLYKKGRWYSILAAFFCFVCILVFGSRGALVAGMLYVVYDLCQRNAKNILYIMLASFFIMGAAVQFGDFLDAQGVSSRTLNFLIGGGLASAEGRDVIYEQVIKLIRDNWLIGLGIYGDRIWMNDEYCHNIILELFIDFGVIVGSIIVIIALFFILNLYLKIDYNKRNVLIKYFIVLLVPFFVSSSYLIDCNFGVFWGIIMLLDKDIERVRLKLFPQIKIVNPFKTNISSEVL